jgi:hypothetical protein
VLSTATKTSFSKFDGLAADILKSLKRSASGGFGELREEIRFLEHYDYGPPLRRALGRAEVRQIVGEARSTVWPHLNDESLKLVSPKEFTRLWSGLGVQFRLARLSGTAGSGLLGFYVRKMEGSRLPLICVNTAHHPVAIGATFSHEMGHHLTGRLFDSHKEHAQLMANTAYGEHLDDPEELAADILVSLGAFPEAIARKIFLHPAKSKPAEAADRELNDSVCATVLKYLEGCYGLSFGQPLPITKKFQYLAGLIHFAKLRRALLVEYEI